MEAAAVWEKITELKVWEDNPRKNKKAIPKVVDSIKRFGFGAPILARKADKKIIAGHTRFAAAKRLGLDRVPVRYLDLDPADSRLLALADNKISEVADWDDEKLSQLIKELEISPESLDLCGWSQEELESMFSQTFIEEDQPPDPTVTEEKREPISKFGEVYKLGQHKLICGDSTDPKTWKDLMGDEKADMVFADPPYNVGFSGTLSNTTRDGILIPHIGANAKHRAIKNDKHSKEDFNLFIEQILDRIRENTIGGWYICFSSSTLDELLIPLIQKKMKWKSIIIFNKNQSPIGGGHFRKKYEPILYGYFENIFYGNKYSEDDVWDIDRTNKNDLHPTMKPIPLVTRAIKYSSLSGDIVVDPFGGSGTTLIAAAQTNRRARLVEIDPSYCDVIRSRWARYAQMNNLPIDDGIV